MKLFHAPTSPFVRKVMMAALERGIADRFELLPAAAHPINRDRAIVAQNPAGKVPTLILDDGTVLYDSRVIIEYLETIPGGPALIPASGSARWTALVLQSLADELCDAAVLLRYETWARPEPLRWADWITGQTDKLTTSCDDLEARWTDALAGAQTIGTIATACALGYLDFRFPDFGWRNGRPKLAAWFADYAARPSFVSTMPPG